MNPNIPEKCAYCHQPILLENLYCDDGCPCNSARGINFKPKECKICRVDNCVKPGHRLTELFGSYVAQCECGAEKSNTTHSIWCPKYQ